MSEKRTEKKHVGKQTLGTKARGKKGREGKTSGERDKFGIDTIHRGFVANLKGIRTFISHLSPIVIEHDRALLEKTVADMEKGLKVLGITKSDIKANKIKKSKLKLTKKQAKDFLSAVTRLARDHALPLHNVELLYNSTLVMIICYFDFLISDLIRYHYRAYPKSLSGKDLALTLNELNLCKDIREAREYLVNKEVEKILYKSLADQIKYFAELLKINPAGDIVHWGKISEAVERRNVIVHNNSLINRRYLKNVDRSVITGKAKGLKEGQKITVNKSYFEAVFDEIFLAGIILVQSCWRKWKKDEIKNADAQLIQVVYDALLEERWALVEKLGLFSRQCTVSGEQSRLCLDINYCQSLKWQNKKGQLAKELKEFDESTLKPLYVVALCALKGDPNRFYKNIKQAIAAGDLTKDDLLEWPLFREFRQDPAYGRKVRRILRAVGAQQ